MKEGNVAEPGASVGGVEETIAYDDSNTQVSSNCMICSPGFSKEGQAVRIS